MFCKELLKSIRDDFSGMPLRVEALVLRRYRSGAPLNFRVDDATPDQAIPGDCSHVLVVLELPLGSVADLATHVSAAGRETTMIGALSSGSEVCP